LRDSTYTASAAVPPAGSAPLAHPPRSRLRAWLGTPAAMVLVALVLRVGFVTVAHTYRFSPRGDNFGFGWETGRIARSLALGQGFSSPFVRDTGPTAWVAPAYPYLVAGVFKLFGVYTLTSGWVLLTLNSVFSALTCWTMFRISEQAVGLRLARWAGWFWALLPYSMYWAVRWVWETSFSAFALSLVLWLTLRLDREPRRRDWIWFGVTWGVIALANPSCLTLLPCCGLWLAWRLSRAHRPWFGGAALAAVIFFALLAPWTVRNYRVFHKIIPVRDNFWVEFRLGNSESANGLWMSWFHPSTDLNEFATYARVGELRYVDMQKQKALGFVRSHPGKFAELCVRRAIWFWIGTPRSTDVAALSGLRNAAFLVTAVLAFWGVWLMLRDRRRGAWLLGMFLVVYPAIYYFTFPHPRYRHPIEPEMAIAGLYVLFVALKHGENAA
jgi:hypothetical protein